jgi:predicted DsbA family dithiol-disulfide isomerase
MAREFEIDVEWQPFELHPETPPEGRPMGSLFGGSDRAQAYFQNLRVLAADSGLEMRPPPLIANSRLALEAAEFAREHGAFDCYHRVLFAAYFRDGQNIGDIDRLVALAAACGMDGGELRAALVQGRYRAVVADKTEQAKEMGVTGTPAFLLDNCFVITGAQDMAVFRDVLRRLGVPQRASGAAADR